MHLAPGPRPSRLPTSRWPRRRVQTTSAAAYVASARPRASRVDDEALSGCGAAARGGQIALAHVDAVLGEQHGRAVQRLVDERGDPGPAAHVTCRRSVSGVGRARGAGHPVKSLIERGRLDRVELGRQDRHRRPVLAQHLLQRMQEPLPPRRLRKAGRTPLGCAGTRPARPPKLRGRRASRSACAPACPPARRWPRPGRRRRGGGSIGPEVDARRGARRAPGTSNERRSRSLAATIGRTCQLISGMPSISRSHQELTPPITWG